MNSRVTWCAPLIAALLCLSSPARADKETIALDFQAPSACPNRARFLERVHTFTTKVEVANDDGAAAHRIFNIRVTRAAGAVHGELTIDHRGTKTTRTVTGTTCDEVVSALALATALAVDPDALGGEPATTEPPVEEPPTPPPVEEPPKPAPEPKPKPKPAPRKLIARPPPKGPARHALDFSLGVRVGDSLAPFPKLETSAELGTSYYAPFEAHLGIVYGPAQHNQDAEYADLLGYLGMGYRFLDLEPFSVWGQAALELGQVQAVGRGIDPTDRVDRLWSAVDVGLSARMAAMGPLFFQANASGRAPLSLQRYVVLENTGKLRELHQVEQLGYLVGLSVGMHFL